MKRRFRSKEEEMEAIRQEPEFQALVREFQGQTPEQRDRFGTWIRREASMDITKRILELVADGLTDRQIAERLTAEGIMNQKGEPFTKNTVRARRDRSQKQARSVISEITEASEQPQGPSLSSDITDISEITCVSDLLSAISDESDATDQSTQASDISEVSDKKGAISEKTDMSKIPDEPMPEAWKRQILQLVQTEIERLMTFQPVQTIQTSDERDLPPVPEKIDGDKGKKIAPGERVKVAGTCDKRLYQLLEQWRRVRGIPFSRALDAALWHFLGKPALSFQATPEESGLED